MTNTSHQFKVGKLKQSFKEITDILLSKKNCAVRDGGMFISNLHAFVRLDIYIVKGTNNPKMSTQCMMIKKYLLYLVDNFDKFKKGAPGVPIK